jgi:hypothetical protein
LVIEEGGLPMVINTPFGELGSLGALQYALVYVRRSDGVVFATSENTDEAGDAEMPRPTRACSSLRRSTSSSCSPWDCGEDASSPKISASATP